MRIVPLARPALVVVVLLSLVALGISKKRIVLDNEHVFTAAVQFDRGITLGTGPAIKSAPFGTIDYAFPFDGGCQLSPNVTMTGARPGDPCVLGLAPADGGPVGLSNGPIGAPWCIITQANIGTVVMCPSLAAGPDAGFQLRALSSR